MDFGYSTSAQRCSSVNSGPMMPLPRGPSSKEWPAFEFPLAYSHQHHAQSRAFIEIVQTKKHEGNS
jgi:hypothetical protein